MFKLILEKAEEPDIKLPTSAGSSKKQESSRKTFVLLTMPKPLTVWITHNQLWKILQEMGIPDHLTGLLRNLYAGQEATVRTGRGVKIAGGNINKLRYAEDTTFMAETEEELKRPLMKVKEESEQPGLKLNIQKTKIMASALIIDEMGKQWIP